ncbi:hypothetical protein [Gordonia liuliyuniae]|uniref:Uncharacterized protein n=1 Tax=Gordonia liuliyuniae TaxID=2911517 RepID=A0ABS9IWP0_9ACTN|nr:hypothetical protein [Gordonia liuliyuniae]MCF8589979.1 hypothetical protein [Gordonia liuliyuniae]
MTAIGVPPSVAHRTVRNGHHAERLDVIGRGVRDGSLSAEMADAVGKAITMVDNRVGLDEHRRPEPLRSHARRTMTVHPTAA